MEFFTLLIILAFIVCYFIAWFFTMQIVSKAAREKGYGELAGKLWFIGFFGLIFTPGIIVSALPDKKLQAAQGGSRTTIQDELPSI